MFSPSRCLNPIKLLKYWSWKQVLPPTSKLATTRPSLTTVAVNTDTCYIHACLHQSEVQMCHRLTCLDPLGVISLSIEMITDNQTPTKLHSHSSCSVAADRVSQSTCLSHSEKQGSGIPNEYSRHSTLATDALHDIRLVNNAPSPSVCLDYASNKEWTWRQGFRERHYTLQIEPMTT